MKTKKILKVYSENKNLFFLLDPKILDIREIVKKCPQLGFK